MRLPHRHRKKWPRIITCVCIHNNYCMKMSFSSKKSQVTCAVGFIFHSLLVGSVNRAPRYPLLYWCYFECSMVKARGGRNSVHSFSMISEERERMVHMVNYCQFWQQITWTSRTAGPVATFIFLSLSIDRSLSTTLKLNKQHSSERRKSGQYHNRLRNVLSKQ